MRVALATGAYTARSVIANCQRCVNLYAEQNPQDAPVPFTYYPTPGLRTLGTAPNAVGRGLFTASNGVLYAVAGQKVYTVASDWTWTEIGTLIQPATTRASIVDNGTTAFIVDGSGFGYTSTLGTSTITTVSDAAFYGSARVDFVDTYFVFNKPGTGIWYISQSNSTAFDPLAFATKIGFSDKLVVAAVVHREVWLIGERTTEVWVNTGAADFPYQLMSGAFVQHGCAAAYSVAQMGDALYWLSQDAQGGLVVLKGQGYQSARVSTHAIETAIAGYSIVSDAIGDTYQQEGHQFYVLTFPTADKTWVFDTATGQWHERVWLDGEGIEHRWRAVSMAYAYGVNVAQDWETGQLYAVDLNVYTDAGAPIIRRRSFPHLGKDGKRVYYREFLADMEVGTDFGVMTQGTTPTVLGPDVVPDTALGPDVIPVFLGIDGTSFAAQPSQLYLRYSDTRGQSWSDPIPDDFGGSGEYLKSIQFQRLGMARDRVFELFWATPTRTALNGAFIEARPEK